MSGAVLRRCTAGAALLLAAALAPQAMALSPSEPPRLKQSPKCDVPFPDEALAEAPADFRGQALVLVSFTVRGEFRSARLLRSSGNETLDNAALRASVGARCEALGNVNDPALQDSLIGIPFAFDFERDRAASPAQALPVR